MEELDIFDLDYYCDCDEREELETRYESKLDMGEFHEEYLYDCIERAADVKQFKGR